MNCRLRSLLTVALLFILLFAASCSKKEDAAARTKSSGRSAPKFPVEVTTVQSRNAEFSVSAVGSVEAFEIVQVTARVSGTVQEVRFKEGEVVHAGDPLVGIEPERYNLAVRSAEAAL